MKGFVTSIIPPGSGGRSKAMSFDRRFREEFLVFSGKIGSEKRCKKYRIFLMQKDLDKIAGIQEPNDLIREK